MKLMRSASTLAVIAWLAANDAFAAGSNMPWEQPLQQILDSVQGPVAKIIAVIIIITTGLTLAFGDTSGGFRRLIQIVFGLSIAFAASSFFLTFFQFAGGAVIAMPPDVHDHLGFVVPLHRSLTEPLLLGGAPRSLAILIGTIAAAVALGLQLWIPGLLIWLIAHPIAVWAGRKDSHFVEVLRRHVRYPGHLSA